MTLQRNMYGLHAPVRQMMERSICRQVRPPFYFRAAAHVHLTLMLYTQTPTPVNLGGIARPSNIHLDILMGRDEEVGPSDIYIGARCHCLFHTLPVNSPVSDVVRTQIVKRQPSSATSMSRWRRSCGCRDSRLLAHAPSPSLHFVITTM